MEFPEEVIYKILEASDIEELVSELSRQLPPYKFEFWRLWPIGEYTHCFYYDGDKKSLLLTPIQLVMRTGRSYEESVLYLAQKYKVSLDPDPALVKYADDIQKLRTKEYRRSQSKRRPVETQK